MLITSHCIGLMLIYTCSFIGAQCHASVETDELAFGNHAQPSSLCRKATAGGGIRLPHQVEVSPVVAPMTVANDLL